MKNYMSLFLVLCAMFSLQNCQTSEVEKITIEEEGFKTVNGVNLYYKTIGKGEPLLFVHGGPVLDHSYFLPQMNILANDYQLIFFDQRLCGKSDMEIDTSTITIDNFVEDIEGIRLAFNLEKVNLVGHSWGGLLAMKYAIKYPDKLKSLILLNSMAGSAELWQKESLMLADRSTAEDSIARAAIIQSEAFQQKRPEAYAELFRLSFLHQFSNPKLADSLTLVLPDDIQERSRKFNYLRSDLQDFDVHEALANVTCPTLLVFGDHEPSAQITAPKLKEAIPNSSLEILQACGHFPYIEQPEQFRTSLTTFINSI